MEKPPSQNNSPFSYQHQISSYLEALDETFLSTYLSTPEASLKFSQLNSIYSTLSSDSKTITIKDFQALRSYAISPGGFLTSKFRRIFYKKIFCVNKTNFNDMVYIDLQSNIPIINDIQGIKRMETKHKAFNKLETSPDIDIIKMDSIRSKVSSIIKTKENRNNIINQIKNDLQYFLSEITSFNGNTYSYFQGYHDIALYFLMLYYNKPIINIGIAVFQRFSEFCLKELLYTSKLNNNTRFEIINSLFLLKEVIHILNQSTYELIINKCTNGLPTFAASWVLSLFTHCLESTHLLYRLFDYFIISHPINVYYLVALIIIEEIEKGRKRKVSFNEVDISFFKFFQELNLDKLDYEYYISKTEENIKKFPISLLKDTFNKIGIKNNYPLAMEESYVLKWVMKNNKDEIKYSFGWYLEGQFNLLKSLLNINKD